MLKKNQQDYNYCIKSNRNIQCCAEQYSKDLIPHNVLFIIRAVKPRSSGCGYKAPRFKEVFVAAEYIV